MHVDNSADPRRSPSAAPAVALLVALLTCIPFLPGLHNDFNFDDLSGVVENPEFRGFSFRHLHWMFTSFVMGHWQPLTWLTLAIDARIWGTATPFGFLLTNLLMHAATSALVFLVALRLLRLACAANAGSPPLFIAAAAAALLFSVHPMRVESVSWTTERRDVQSALFLLLSLWAYLRAQERAQVDGRRPRVRWSILCFALSLLSKVMGVTLPLVLLLLDVFPLRRRRDPAVPWRALVVEKLPFLVLAAAAATIAPLAQLQAGDVTSLADHGPLQRIAQCCYGLGFYLWKSAWPVHLSAMYELILPVDPARPRYALSILGVLVVGALLVVRAKRNPAPLVAAVTYAVVLTPVLGLIQCGRQEVADRYSYLASICWTTLLGGALFRFLSKAKPRARFAAVLLVAGVLSLLVLLTWRQTQVWRSSLTLWRSAVANGPPSPFAHYNYGCALQTSGELPAAIDQYRRSIALDERCPEAHFNLGNALRESGRIDEALLEYERSVAVRPSFVKGWYPIASICASRKEWADAASAYRRIIALEPDSLDARHRLGRLLFDAGRVDEAIAVFAGITRRWPDLPVEHYDLGCALEARGRRDDAVREYRLALQLRPDFPEASANLAELLKRK